MKNDQTTKNDRLHVVASLTWGRDGTRHIGMLPNGDPLPLDAAKPLDARLRDLYPESVWRRVWVVPGSELPRVALAASRVCNILLRHSVQRSQIFWTRPDMASVALYTAVERVAGAIWAKQAQNAAESCDRAFDGRVDKTLRASIVDIALRAASALREPKTKGN